MSRKKDEATPAANEPAPTEAPVEEAAVSVKEEKIRTKLSATMRAEITERARKKVQAEVADREAKAFLEAELQRLRAEAGVDKPGLGGANDDIVKIRIDLGDNDDGTADPYIQLDMPYGAKYYHGVTYEVPRHVANVLNEQMYRLMLHNLNKAGKSVFRGRKYNSLITQDLAVTHQGEVH